MSDLVHFLCGGLCFSIPILLLLCGWLILRVLYPLKQLTWHLNDLVEGNLATFEQPIGGIPEIDRLRRSMLGMVQHIWREQDGRRAYAEALTNGQEAKRSHLAHELHDDTVQSLIVIGQNIDMANYWIETRPQQASGMLKAARDNVNETVSNLRNLIADLRPPALEELGLVAALQSWAERLTEIAPDVEVRGTVRRLDEARELTLFRCAQEALSNVQRHSGATEARIEVTYQPDGTYLTVYDNGTGFNLPENLDSFACDGHYGLVGIQERVSNFGGSLHIHSTQGQGTQVEVFVPAEEAVQPANTVRDPVCHARIEPHQAYSSRIYIGRRFYFCCPVCEGAFQKSPEVYLRKQASGEQAIAQAVESMT